MKIRTLRSFERDLARQTPGIQEATREALRQLLVDPRHPALRFKKIQGHDNARELRVSCGYRVTLEIDAETYSLRRVGPHDILKQP